MKNIQKNGVGCSLNRYDDGEWYISNIKKGTINESGDYILFTKERAEELLKKEKALADFMDWEKCNIEEWK
jgi:hypothetical protein